MAAAVIVDPERIGEITQGSAALLRRFRRLLEQTLEESLPALEADDPETRRRAAHRLKGACANLGAVALQSAFEALEQAGPEGAPETLGLLAPLRASTLARLDELAEAMERPGI